MAIERLQITPAIITWARKRAGLSLDEARHYGRVDEWESGASSPTYAQIEALAAGLKVPVSVFFFPAPPDLPDIAKSFRTLPEIEFESIPSRVRLLLRKAKAFQLNLAELTGSKNPASRLIIKDLKLSASETLPAAAEKVRSYLGISLETQQSYKTDEDALKAWRDAFQSVGVFVFKDAFKNEDFSGFCLYDETFPLIYVNNSSAKTRQMFTLFHELAHLLFQTSGVDKFDDQYIAKLDGDSKDIEVFCNAFAAEILLPAKALADAMKGRKSVIVFVDSHARTIWPTVRSQAHSFEFVFRSQGQNLGDARRASCEKHAAPARTNGWLVQYRRLRGLRAKQSKLKVTR